MNTKLKEWLKQLFCRHKYIGCYAPQGPCALIKGCSKCGKIKS